MFYSTHQRLVCRAGLATPTGKGTLEPRTETTWKMSYEEKGTWTSSWTFTVCISPWYGAIDKTHTFCRSVQQLHCDPEAGVYTCSGQGLAQSWKHTHRQDSDILWLGMAVRGVSQREPLQSQSCVVCTWTTWHYLLECMRERCLISCDYSMCYLCVQKHCVSGPMSLQSIAPGTPKLTYSLFFTRRGSTFLLYSSYCSGVKSLPPSSSPTILETNQQKLKITGKILTDSITYLCSKMC